MLDGFLKSKYHTKCKSLLRMVKTRLEVLKKKKCSVVKFLKNDIADLLRNNLDLNAYGRVQGLLVEQKMITCYDFMDQFCDCVSNNVNAMAKQRTWGLIRSLKQVQRLMKQSSKTQSDSLTKECPEECKEAIQSLMYAAARISEIPELRDLRKVFTERYGSLEPYTNKQFVESFKPVSATKEMKLQTLDEIAAEFNLNWNSKSLENELTTHDEKNGHSSFKNKDEGKKGSSYTKRNTAKNEIEDEYNLPKSSSEDEMISSRRTDSSDLASSSSVGNSSEDEIESKKPLSHKSIPPPYVKAASTEPPKDVDFGEDAKAKPRSVRRRPVENIGSVDQRPLKPPPGRERSMDGKDQEAAKILSWRNSNEGFGIRKSKSDEMPERVVDEEAEKAMKKHNRTVSAQPQFKHVHPNLPDDFDDLAARLAALRER